MNVPDNSEIEAMEKKIIYGVGGVRLTVINLDLGCILKMIDKFGKGVCNIARTRNGYIKRNTILTMLCKRGLHLIKFLENCFCVLYKQGTFFGDQNSFRRPCKKSDTKLLLQIFD